MMCQKRGERASCNREVMACFPSNHHFKHRQRKILLPAVEHLPKPRPCLAPTLPSLRYHATVVHGTALDADPSVEPLKECHPPSVLVSPSLSSPTSSTITNASAPW
jgi:hypothetical protein